MLRTLEIYSFFRANFGRATAPFDAERHRVAAADPNRVYAEGIG
ncbi:hypothetical protein [Nocardia sp. NPDC005825]